MKLEIGVTILLQLLCAFSTLGIVRPEEVADVGSDGTATVSHRHGTSSQVIEFDKRKPIAKNYGAD